ncbi:MAG TPA: DinB family protein [Gemmataceae bacterium]|nr:DinB family protein [Gemmataceae bacterium]
MGPLVGLLDQLLDLVESLSDEEYARKPVGVVPSSVGGHVRHNLDHVLALLRGLRGGEVNYDHRDRGTDVERDRLAALAEILRLEEELTAFPWDAVPHLVKLTALVAPDRPPVTTLTSAERELAFVVSHTIHHNAIIGIMARLLGTEVPADFGYAPSTIAHQWSRACAR